MMSSAEGERFALLTIKNTSSGQRIFNQDHLEAILGDCNREFPAEIESKFNGGQVSTLQIYFGFSRFPILKLIK